MLPMKIIVFGFACLTACLGSAQASMLLVDANKTEPSSWLDANGNYDVDEWEADTALGLTFTRTGAGYNNTLWSPTYDLWAKLQSVEGTLIPAGAYNMLSNRQDFSPTITVTNLKAGTYDLTVYGVKGETNSNTFSYTFNGVPFGSTENVPYNNPAGLTAAQIVAKITKTGSITIPSTGTYANKLVITGPIINGFTLTPEPATLALLALGGLTLLRRRA